MFDGDVEKLGEGGRGEGGKGERRAFTKKEKIDVWREMQRAIQEALWKEGGK